jgi:D-sedoheptulose 7-phosphate isomerase
MREMSMSEFNGIAERYFTKLQALLSAQNRQEIDAAVEVIAQAWKAGNQIVVFGNGGSALTALHFCTDWTKSISMRTGRPFLARTLVDNICQ